MALKLLKFPTTNRSRNRSLNDAFTTAKKGCKDNGFTKLIIIMMDENDSIHYEAANITDIERVYALESAKHLILRDAYGNKP